MGLCPDSCADFTLTPILNAACKVEERKLFIKRFGFYKCNITIPNPYGCEDLKAIMAPDEGTPGLVFSNELQGVTIGEPTKVSRELSDYRPEYQETVSRQITFNDRIAVDLDSAGAASPYLDYDWWKNIYNLRNQLNVLFLMNDDTIRVPRKQGGSLEGLPVQLDVFLNQEKVQNGFIAEFKQGTVTFLGDPLFFNKPGISLTTCEDLSGLY